MWVFFGDESTHRATALPHPFQQVFVLAGFAVQHDELTRLMEGIEAAKEQYGLKLRHPVKYNMRDDGLRAYYRSRRESALLKRIIPASDGLRGDLLSLLAVHSAKTFICAMGSWGTATHKTYYAWAATNLFQRLGYLGSPVKKTPELVICLDWPTHDVGKAYFDIYHDPWHDGVGHDGSDFFCGKLRSRSCFPDLAVGSTLHSPFLQLADLVVGATADFITWCLTERYWQRVEKFFPLVARQLHSHPSFRVSQTGFITAPKELQARVRLGWQKMRGALRPT